ncbi:hypothetical protein BDQ12DRAFT_606089 [Crucibulum laeve]|uniref:Actin-like ATPase domain-containing protein n=1 Tax=Crucibulum laeve TaxID=68775 RepID=A0A5C3M2V4_9AGAR|nr:hypothetical protein BDQ12DRAFT_606089 [Crucibulum laeve]
MPPNRKPYKGKEERLVVSVDIGTTFTAASWCILVPGQIPKFESIVRWPDQFEGSAKVPSVVYYDESRKPRAFGARNIAEPTTEAEHRWLKLEWWKLVLRPAHLLPEFVFPELPQGITVDKIFADFLSYIKECLQKYMQDAVAGDKWGKLSLSLTLILTTPRCWLSEQQERMRVAAINSGLVESPQQVRFVSEAEAAVLYAADTGRIREWLKASGLFGLLCLSGTIDISSYQVISAVPLQLEELTPAHCYVAGSVLINESARKYIEERLLINQLGADDADDPSEINSQFEAKKCHFKDPNKVMMLQVAGHITTNLDITRGRLEIPGTKIAEFFDISLDAIIKGMKSVISESRAQVNKVILVGGLASNIYVFSRIQKWAKDAGVIVIKPDGGNMKVVAEGALAWHLDSSVASRIAKYHYGTKTAIRFDSTNPDMEGRKVYFNPTGDCVVNGGWAGIGMKIRSKKEFGGWHHRECTDDEEVDKFEFPIYAFTGTSPPLFIKKKGQRQLNPHFIHICTIKCNLQECYDQAKYRKSPTGRKYKIIEVSPMIHFPTSYFS